MKNIIITGNVNIGKSTVLKKVLDMLGINSQYISGLKTQSCLRQSKITRYYMEPINIGIKLPRIEKRIIGIGVDGNKVQSFTSNFEKFGVKVLDNCLNNTSKLVVIDELGVFEKYAYNFQRKIHQVLNSNKLVIAVIKQVSVPFLNEIRSRQDVLLYEITECNRDIIPNAIYNNLNRIANKELSNINKLVT